MNEKSLRLHRPTAKSLGLVFLMAAAVTLLLTAVRAISARATGMPFYWMPGSMALTFAALFWGGLCTACGVVLTRGWREMAVLTGGAAMILAAGTYIHSLLG
ncbi:hypothetical protein [Paraburkholderia sp. J8-2]|uniref:hypothetical protein n=1 Tax=Paraburkholderia sp. J8-2 TaxID=2805440 RepID=UPI002AB74ADB|nr:hypothetical protein [Paraburkholderia sp. J8-2]